jgi:AraC-like DNA-binding protein
MSIQHVARRAGVSVATVSRAFNQPGQVAPATRQQIEQAAQALGYLPNASARTLRTQRSRVLGVVLPSLLNPVFAECLQGMAEAAARAGYALVPHTTDYELGREEQAVRQLLAANVDGWPWWSPTPASRPRCRPCRRAPCPMCWPTTSTRITPAWGWTASRPWPIWWRAWPPSGTAASPWSAASARPPTAPPSAAAATSAAWRRRPGGRARARSALHGARPAHIVARLRAPSPAP